MKEKGISQEMLKLIACVTMLIDHIGATVVLRMLQSIPQQDMTLYWTYYAMRIVGRIAFPIYCFLLVEGAAHTRSPKKYALRLFVGMLLAEIPFDLAFSYRGFVPFDWSSNSVMVTLLLGFGMLMCMDRVRGVWKAAVALPFYIMAELLQTDYAGLGIAIIAVFALTRGLEREKLWCAAGLCLVLYPGARMNVGGVMVNLEWFAALALIPIFCYNGRKLTGSKAAQWGFYLFYPVHLLILAILTEGLFG